MTTIGPTLVITGDVTSHEDITIHGRVKGQVHIKAGALVVAPKGTVEAKVEGLHVMIHGTLAGDVVASERLELTQTANVTGTLTTPTVVVREGATFNGMLDMDRKGARAKLQGNKLSPVAAERVA
jgi:cytoskeletal protein CcmA (bactofilin family)